MNYFKIQFYDAKKEVLTLKAKNVSPTSFLGLIEVSDIIFKEESPLLVTPEDDRTKIEFKNVTTTYIPISHIIRIDEITEEDRQPLIRLVKEKDDNHQ